MKFIKMSLTSPGCPVAGELPKQVADELTKIKNIGLIEAELVGSTMDKRKNERGR